MWHGYLDTCGYSTDLVFQDTGYCGYSCIAYTTVLRYLSKGGIHACIHGYVCIHVTPGRRQRGSVQPAMERPILSGIHAPTPGVARCGPRAAPTLTSSAAHDPGVAHRGAAGSAYNFRVATAVQSPPTPTYLAAPPSRMGATAVSRPEGGGWSYFLGLKSGAPSVRRHRSSPPRLCGDGIPSAPPPLFLCA